MVEAKEIPLTKGMVAMVDAEDYERLNQRKWYAMVCASGVCYAARTEWPKGTGRKGRKGHRTVMMHKQILAVPAGLFVDHVNGNGLDNRRSNLRAATKTQNNLNRGAQKNNKSGFKGVWWHSTTNKWRASIRVNGKSVSLGLFTDKESAHARYLEAAKDLAGEFARGA